MLSKPSYFKKGGFVCQWLGNVDMHTVCMQNVIKTYHVVQEFYLIYYLTTDGQTDERTYIVIIVQIQGTCN